VSDTPPDMPRRDYVTVAELIDRERTPTEDYPWAAPERRPQALTPVTDLLRREGVRIDGLVDEGETLAAAPQELPSPEDEERPANKRGHKVAAMAGVAALSGLTIAGLIALSPSGSAPTSNSAAPGGDGTQAGTSPADGGSTAPSSTQLKRASSEKTPAPAAGRQDVDQSHQGGATPGSATQQPGGGGAPAPKTGAAGSHQAPDTAQGQQPGGQADGDTGTTQPAPEAPEPTSPPKETQPQQPPQSKPKPRNPVGGLVGGVTDTLGKTVEGVTGLLGGVLGTTSAPESSSSVAPDEEPDPTTGSKSGTLDVN